MAKVIYGAGVSQMSGKQGGTVFSRNKSGAYTRTNRKGTNPNTASQQARRAAFADASRYFKTLTAIQQQSFKDQAINYPQIDRLGQTVTLSGAQLANKYANLRRLAGFATTPVEIGAPVYLNAAVSALADLTVSAGEITGFELTYVTSNADGSLTSIVPAGVKCVIKATKLYGNGFTAPKSKDFRVLKVLASGTDIADYAVDADYAALFGVGVGAGDVKLFVSFELVSSNTPQSTAPFVTPGLV